MLRHALAGLFVVVFAAVGVSQEKKDDKKAMNLYPLAKGTKCEYTLTVTGRELDVTIEVTEVSEPKKGERAIATLVTKVGDRSSTEYFSADDKGVYQHAMQGQKLETPIVAVKYPVKDGTKWTEKMKQMGIELEAEFEQKKAEEVKVPAGKYTAYPVVMTIKTNGRTYTETKWYAEGVGIVKWEIETGGDKRLVELKKFTAAK
jgi:hypothetical protein